MTRVFVLSILGLALAVGAETANRADLLPASPPTRSIGGPADSIPHNPERNAYFGDLHLHTGYSFDAYTMGGAEIDPATAYAFAQGKPVRFMGHTVVHTYPPLDFMAVTDHAEWIGVAGAVDAKTLAQFQGWQQDRKTPGNIDIAALERSAWQREMDAANQAYRPGIFTTLIAYEWTSAPGDQNMHRNVIFRGDAAPAPFTAHDSKRPEDLWTYLEAMRRRGHEALAIPHNANWSNGLMFDWVQSEGKPIDRAYALRQALNEPLTEIVQNKGQSEIHPELAPVDEMANFEVWDHRGFAGPPGKKPGSYVRDGLGRGLVLARRTGANPFKFGFVGGSDFHNGLSDAAERAYSGALGTHYPEQMPFEDQMPQSRAFAASLYETSSGGLTGVWAEQNTRASIYAALRRKETFATSGTRLRVRFFAGWQYPEDLLAARDWVSRAYRGGVAMGGDLPENRGKRVSPRFLIWAAKDPNGANLDRAQVIKVSLQNGRYRERIFDVALSGGRKAEPRSGKVAPVGNTVDVSRATYSNRIGAGALATTWHDPEFDPAEPSAYYLRVIEIPTPRWTTIQAVRQGRTLPKNVPATLQERAWSSPIWYTPTARQRTVG